MKGVKIKGELETAFYATCFLFIFYGPIILKINNIQFSATGDGLKNYYTFIYQIIHGEDMWHFDGMNYPFGEHIIFTDAQPLLVWVTNIISHIIPILTDHLFAILNSLMFLSIVIATVYVYKIFRYYNVERYSSILAAIAITFFAPQLDRMTGHYSLSYVCFIPMLWYYLILFNNTSKLFYTLIISLLIFLFGLIHVYYTALAASFILSYILVSTILGQQKPRNIVQMILQFSVPVLAIQIILVFTDHVSDRPDSQMDFLYYRSYLEGLLLPMTIPAMDWFRDNIFAIRLLKFESIAYLGSITTIVLIYWLFLFVRQKLNLSTHPCPTGSYFGAGLLLTLFSLGVPFIFGLEFLVEYLGPLQQFRSIGRFAWPFYFVANVSVFIWIYNITSSKIGVYTKLLMSIGLVLFSAEIIYKNIKLSKSINNPTEVNLTELNKDEKIQYQAILPLPYFHIGSEWMSRTAPDEFISNAFNYSINTGIPILSTMLSRTSSTQSMEFLGIIHGQGQEMDIHRRINSKQILVVADTSLISGLNMAETMILVASNLVSNMGKYSYYELDPDFFKTNRKYKNIGKIIHQKRNIDLSDDYEIYPSNIKGSGKLELVINAALPIHANDQVYYGFSVAQGEQIDSFRFKAPEDLHHVGNNYISYAKTIDIYDGDIKIRVYRLPESNKLNKFIKEIKVYKIDD